MTTPAKSPNTDVSVPAKASSARQLSPACDVYENRDEYLIVAEVPGVEEHDVSVLLDRTRLTIEALRHDGGPTYGEGAPELRYVRAFEVPDTIDADGIRAKLSDGVLNVHLPKSAQARIRQIKVTSA